MFFANMWTMAKIHLTLHRFVIKTREQRQAEKALMDKSPLNALTLEDFLESERHKLTGNLTPVTVETFAAWKKDRLDKKAAEEVEKLTGRVDVIIANAGESWDSSTSQHSWMD